jgi:hypothetical protein
MLKVGVGEDTLEEIAADGQSCARTLAKLSCAEVYAAIFSTYPCTCNEFRRNTHKPGIGMIV